MYITIDTTQPLSEADKDTLAVLMGGSRTYNVEPVQYHEPAPAEEEKPAPKKRAPAKKKATEDVEEEVVEEDLDQELLDKAIARATELLKAKETELVKKALADAGVQRVSHLNSNDKIKKVLNTFEEATS